MNRDCQEMRRIFTERNSQDKEQERVWDSEVPELSDIHKELLERCRSTLVSWKLKLNQKRDRVNV